MKLLLERSIGISFLTKEAIQDSQRRAKKNGSSDLVTRHSGQVIRVLRGIS